MYTINKLGFAAIVALAVPGLAVADTITLNTASGGLFGSPALYSDVQIMDGSNTLNVRAGGFNVISTDNESFLAWCIDLADSLILNNTVYDVVDTPLTFGTANVADAVDNLSRLFTGFLGDVDTGDKSAAFQVAIWEIISDTGAGLDLNAGSFKLMNNAGVDTIASGYLTGLSGYGADYDLSFFANDGPVPVNGSQDLVTGQPSPVPLPATGLLLLAGLGGLAMTKRKRA